MVQVIREIMEQIKNVEMWNINLVGINVSKKEGIKYSVEELSDFDTDGIIRTAKEISQQYLEGDKANIYKSIEQYDSTLMSDVVYEMELTNELIRDAYEKLITALAMPDKESDPTKMSYDCYVLKGNIEKDGEDNPIKLIFMKNPIKTLKNRFIKIREKYTEITGNVINLSLLIDMIVWKDKIYFFNNSGEKLFNMERTYKRICQEKVLEIKEKDIISDIESFVSVANSGYNPRRFISFNKQKLEMLEDDSIRHKISLYFEIPIVDGKFDTSKVDATEKLIKVLCDKGKLDPFNNKPVEVAGVKEWK